MNGESTLDSVDRALIRETESGLPLVPRPFDAVAERLGLPVQEVLWRFRRLAESGVIRRVAAVPNHYKLGYRANGMTVWDVEDSRVSELGRRVGALDFVSHCYLRPRHLPDWPYNLFAMVHGKTREETAAHAARIAEVLGDACRGQTVLYSKRILKKTGFRSGPARAAGAAGAGG